MKNELLIIFDSESDKNIKLSKPELPEKIISVEQAKAIVNIDIETLTMALVSLIESSSKLGLINK